VQITLHCTEVRTDISKETDSDLADLADLAHQPEYPPRLGAKIYEYIKDMYVCIYSKTLKTVKELLDAQQQLIYAINGHDAMLYDMEQMGYFNDHTEQTIAIIGTIAEQRVCYAPFLTPPRPSRPKCLPRRP
jgi:hypothetical protein